MARAYMDQCILDHVNGELSPAGAAKAKLYGSIFVDAMRYLVRSSVSEPDDLLRSLMATARWR